ncbi:MAG: helix-turn-helix domain-containing protein [Candidatus Neomarinimicrobiota bacterium]|jgi:hypothetical protein
MKRKIRYQKIRKNRLYTVKTLQDCLGISRSTVMYWCRNNLLPINHEERPWIFEGETVKTFLRSRSLRRKTKLNPGEFYCCHCRCGVTAEEEYLEFIDTGILIGKGSNRRIIISGKCINCGKKVSLIWSYARLNEFIQYYPKLKTNGLKMLFNKAASE